MRSSIPSASSNVSCDTKQSTRTLAIAETGAIAEGHAHRGRIDKTTASSEPLTRPTVVTVLAILQLGAGWLICLVILGSLVVGTPPFFGWPEYVIAGLLLGVGALQIACGDGLLKLRPYGRILQLGFAWVGLIGFPIGTIISILILLYFRKPEIKALFAAKSIGAAA